MPCSTSTRSLRLQLPTTGLALFAGLLLCVLAAPPALAKKFSHHDNMEAHLEWVREQTPRVETVSSCAGYSSCVPTEGISILKTYKEKSVTILNLTGQELRLSSWWLDLGQDGDFDSSLATPDDGWQFEFLGFDYSERLLYRFNTHEDTHYEFSSGSWMEYQTIGEGLHTIFSERLEELFFIYRTNICADSDDPNCHTHTNAEVGWNPFSLSQNFWTTNYRCEDDFFGTVTWHEVDIFDLHYLQVNDAHGFFVLGPGACGDEDDTALSDVSLQHAIETYFGYATTEWSSLDDPGPDGFDTDSETLGAHVASGTIATELVGIEPAYVEMRSLASQDDVVHAAALFELTTLYGGVVSNDPESGVTDDFEIRFHFGASPWINTDTPFNSGDYETHTTYTDWDQPGNEYAGRMPNRDPNVVFCRGADYPEVIFSNASATNADGYIEGDLGDGQMRLFRCDTEVGYLCNNSYNTSRGYSSCHGVDVEVRFGFGHEEICAGNALDGMDNGFCDATDGAAKIVANWNSNLCLNIIGNNSSTWGNSANVWHCSGVTERWRFNLETGKVHAAWNPSLCLNAVGNNSAGNGSNVNLWPCSQVLETWEYDETTGHLRAGWNSSLCLDVSGWDTHTAGTNVQTWACDSVTETWRIEYDY